MYVGYLLDKEVGMYHQGPVRRSGINMPAQNFVSTPQYSEYTGYHHVPNMDSHAQSSGTWGSPYGTPREDWNAYGLGPSNALPTPMSSSSPAQVAYCSPDYNSMHPAGSGVLPPPPENVTVGPPSPDSERHHSYDWMRKTVQSSSTGKYDGTQEQTRSAFLRFRFMNLYISIFKENNSLVIWMQIIVDSLLL